MSTQVFLYPSFDSYSIVNLDKYKPANLPPTRLESSTVDLIPGLLDAA